MKRKMWLLIGCLLMFSTLPLWSIMFSNFARIDTLNNLLSPKNIGVLFRDEAMQQLRALQMQNFTLMLASVVLIVLGSICLIRPAKSLLLVVGFASMLLLIGSVSAENLYIRPRITMPVWITLPNGTQRLYDSVFTTMTTTRTQVSGGFVAYMLGVGNPNSLEFVEIGYFLDLQGFHIYASEFINGNYELRDVPVQEGQSVDFTVWSFGTVAYVQFDGFELGRVTFSNVDHLDFVIQGETQNPQNIMNNTFREVKAGFWSHTIDIYGNGSQIEGYVWQKEKWRLDYIQVTNETPYAIAYTTAGYSLDIATVTGGIGGNTGGDRDTLPRQFGSGGGDIKKRH